MIQSLRHFLRHNNNRLILKSKGDFKSAQLIAEIRVVVSTRLPKPDKSELEPDTCLTRLGHLSMKSDFYCCITNYLSVVDTSNVVVVADKAINVTLTPFADMSL